jgi:hypothetical protein
MMLASGPLTQIAMIRTQVMHPKCMRSFQVASHHQLNLRGKARSVGLEKHCLEKMERTRRHSKVHN